jgi:hypothetical protein
MLCFTLSLTCQTLQLSSASVAAGQTTKIEILLHAPPAKEPTALQWEVEYPARQVMLEPAGLESGPAAKSAGKQINCAGRWKKAPLTYSYLCILAGGQKVIEDGVIAILNIRAPAGAQPGKYSIRVDRAMAVTHDLKKIMLKKADGVVTVTR